MSIEAMRLALEALEEAVFYTCGEAWVAKECEAAITALRLAIAQAEQAQPVAWVCYGSATDEKHAIDYDQTDIDDIPVGTMLYTAPRQWQGLTDKEVKPPIQRAMQHFGFDATQYSLSGAATIGFLGLVREIEAKLKEKNA